MAIGYNELKYNSWKDFKQNIAMDISGKDIFPLDNYIFRGQPEEEWQLISSFDRNYKYLDYKVRLKLEKNLLKNFKARCIRWNEFVDLQSIAEERIAIVAQHFGLPTRLLDWTNAIYIAAFFAFSEANLFVSSSSNVAIWIADKNHEIWNSKKGVSIVNDYIPKNNRQRNQQGLFMANFSPYITIEEYVEACMKYSNTEGALYKALIPISEAKNVLLDLNMMGIDYYNILGGIDGCAKAATTEEILKLNF